MALLLLSVGGRRVVNANAKRLFIEYYQLHSGVAFDAMLVKMPPITRPQRISEIGQMPSRPAISLKCR